MISCRVLASCLASLAFSSFTALEAQTGTALVRHAPSINGSVEGSIQQMTGEGLTLNGGAKVTKDLLVPGTPTVRLNGNPNYAGTLNGTGSASPSTYQITLNGNSTLRNVVRRTDPVTLPTVSAPPSPAGTRSVNINSASDSPGSFSTLRNLTLHGGVGQFAIPAGTYGNFVANGGSGFTLGVAGAAQPSVYYFQNLTLDGQTQIQVLGPVIVTVANGFAGNGALGSSAHAGWLTLNVYSGGFTLNGGGNVYGYVNAPNGTVSVNGNSQLIGGVTCDRLTVNGNGLLRLDAVSGGGTNNAPIAANKTVSLNEDTSASVTLSATDADGNAVAYTVLTSPAHGSLSGTAPNLIYTPAANYNGTDSFTFKANDGQTDSNPATVTLTIQPVNDGPAAEAKTVSLAEGTSTDVILSGTDVDGDTLTFTVTTAPRHGTLSGTSPNLIYTPAANYNGTDAFAYMASDSSLSSIPATVGITITPVNDAPVANSATYSVNEGATLAIPLTASDVDGDALTYAVLSQPSRGSLSGAAPSLSYQPYANFSGLDGFTFQASDGTTASAPATITIQVSNLNDPPVANAQSVTTAEDTVKAITLTGSDPDADAITFTVVTGPLHGALSGTAPNLTYTPALNYYGPDSFSFSTLDAALDSNVATVSLTITPVNDAPIANAQTCTTSENTPTSLTLTGSDVDHAALTFAIVTPPTHGTLSGTAPTFTYTPAPNFNGVDSFTFKASDGIADSAPATVALTVALPNDAPVVVAGPDQLVRFTPSEGSLRGRIVVNNDEWALTDDGFNASPFAAAFARNLADYLSGGKPGAKFLAYTNVLPGSVPFIYTGTRLAIEMQAAGHTWTTSSTIQMSLANLLQYDAVFLGANSVDNQVLIDYVNAGGSVYLSAGTHWSGGEAEVEAALWNTFLNHFGLKYRYPYNNIGGTLPVTSSHPLFYGIATLFFANGNSVARLNPDDPATELPFVYQGQGLFGIAGGILNETFLHGSVTDDGRPNPPASFGYQWTQVSGPRAATIDSPNTLATRARLPAPGIYTFRLTGSDGAKTGSDDVAIVANATPQVYAGADQVLRDTTAAASLAAVVTDDNVTQAGLIYSWDVLSGPGTVTFSAPASLTTTATFSAPGIYVVRISANDGQLVGFDAVEMRVGTQSLEPAAGLVAWWPFNYQAIDVVSGSHKLGIAFASYVAGKVGSGLSLSGTTDSAVTSGHPDLDIGSAAAGFTIEFWMNSGSSAPMLSWADGLSLYLFDGNRLAGNLREANGTNHPFDSYQWGSEVMWIGGGSWTHVAMAYDRFTGLLRFYQNGQLKHIQNFGITTFGTRGDFALGSNGFTGLFDEVSLYNRPLVPAEVAAIYHAGAGGKSPPDNNTPPTLSAGPDLALPSIATAANLNGSVVDDNRPFGAPAVSWSKVEGPGTVAFANSGAAQTTATFSAAGTYLLKLTANENYSLPVSDTVEVRIGANYLIPPAGMAAWWPGNGEANEIVHGIHAVELINGATYITGKVLQGFQFPGGLSYGKVKQHADFDLGASAAGFTIEYWMNSGSNATMLSWANGAYLHLFDGNRLAGNLRDANGTNHPFDSYQWGAGVMWISAGTWHHVVIAYDRSTGVARFHQNGQLKYSWNIGSLALATNNDLIIGGGGFSGALDEVTLYQRALTPAEVAAVYDVGVNGKLPPSGNAAPVVNAGADVLVASNAAAVSLHGSVSDDHLPFGAPTVAWSKVDGPGTVTFLNSGSVQTSASFSIAGTYLLRLTASDGSALPVSDLVEVRVGGGYADRPVGISAWWPGNGEPREVVNGNHDVELINGAGYATAKVSQGFSFPGGASYGRVKKHADLDIGASADGFTLEYWMNSGANATMLSWANGAYLYLFDGNRLAGNLREANGTHHAFDTYQWGGGVMWISAGTWHHVAIAYDRPTGVARFYQNGQLRYSWTIGPLALGTVDDFILGGGGFSGSLDEVSLYQRPLSATEIVAIYNSAGLGKKLAPPNSAPVANAGVDQTTAVTSPLSLLGSASDDGLPNPPAALTYQWSRVSGPGTSNFSSATSLATRVTFSAVGSYVLRLTASDSELSHSDDVSITVSAPPQQPPTVALTAPTNNSVLAANTPVTLTASAADSDGTVSKVEFFDGPAKLGEALSVPYDLIVAPGFGAGTHTLTAQATDNAGITTTSAPVSITVIADPGPPLAEIGTPVEDARISSPTGVTGVVASAILSSWSLEYRLKAADGENPASWIATSTGTAAVGTPAEGTTTPAVPGALGTFDPTLLINGIYEIRLRATDTSGRVTLHGPITLVVEGNLKVGAFTIAFEDLKVPVAGIPITLTRTYDSRDGRVGDFGPGWRLALNNIRVQKNRHLGTAWWQTPQSGSGIQFYYVEPLRDRIVTVVMPDGETHRFKAGAYVKVRAGDPDNASFAVVVRQGKYRFYPVGDTAAKLEPLNQANQLAEDFWIAGTGDQDLRADDPSSDPFAANFNATRFRLTTSDGTVFILDEALGLLELRDLDGNTLVLNRDGTNRVTGVTSTLNAPGGPITRSITIVRDATGRVDYIRDPAGRDLDYLYDAQGRLASFANRVPNITQFAYENPSFPFFLTRIIDPRGVTALRSEYDAAGKLVKQIDADGKETIFNRGAGVDAASRFEKVKDRLGNETTFFYDARGNVLTKIDPLGAQTTFGYYPDSDRVAWETDHYGNVKSMAYDAQGNVTVQTLGARITEDPANPTTGHITRTTYNAQSAPTQMVDPDGRVQAFTYDPATNNLLTHTVGAGGPAPSTTTYTYKSDGTLDTITDALGNATSHNYNYAFGDAAYPGAVKQITMTVTDPAGAAGSDPSNPSHTVLRSTRTLFDAQENQLAQIATRTLPDSASEDVVTRYLYDTENRLQATLMPDGRVTETRYTSFGKEDKSVLWKSVADFQAHNDANARITSHAYDARGNQVSVTHADGTTEVMGFDLENRKAWAQDRRGYRTFFTYDAAGRPRFTISPDANDGIGAGAPVSLSDSRLADNPRTETVYDLAGRVTDTYDELRRRTQSIYFADGTPDASRRRQMVAIQTGGNLVTAYQYDKAGNVRFVTDPRGNTVETRYDDRGRPDVVIYPATDEHLATQTQTKYDALGRRIEVGDQEGKLTRYRYDGLGRMVEVRQYIDQSLAASDANLTLAPSTAGFALTRYAYDALGNQQTQTDSLGRVTTFWTDSLGRRTKRILPKDATAGTFLTETLQYEEWGNLWQRTDFAGKTTTFSYDPLNRLKSKSADATHPSLGFSHAVARIEYDHDANGARSAARTYNASNMPLYTESTPRDERGRLDFKDTAGGRLDYSYHANNRLKDVVSSNPGGINVGYRYDELNRLESVDDTSTGLPTRTTGYTYNANGSLATVAQPNGVVHTYDYDALNRLRAFVVARGSTLVHTYEYKLRASGHRRQAIENSTKTTTYSYDDLYRLADETVAGDPHGNNGSVGYALDKVGNRSARTSSVASVPAVVNQSFNSRDWLNSDTYTANGSTVVGQLAELATRGTDTYDFEEHLILRSKSDGTTINLGYDADGHRIAKNIFGPTAQPVSSTAWLVDSNNLTGYAQVFEERTTTPGNSTLRVYTYGSSLIGQATSLNSQPSSVSYHAYDGHGSARELTNPAGAVTDRYDYDAFGILVFSSGTTANAYRYCGEQFDADLALYYLRARYLNADSGRFWSMDSYEGSSSDPMSLHKYLYANADPVRFSDPSGHQGIGQTMLGVQVAVYLWLMAHPTAVVVGTTTIAVVNVVMFVVDDEFRAMTLAMPNPGGMLANDLRVLMRTGTNLSKRFVFQFETSVARLSTSAPKAAPEAVLYQKLDAEGNHLKFGITKDPVRRYSKVQLNGGLLSILGEGSRKEMLELEAALHKSIPAGSEEAQLFYFGLQAREGIRPPPYDLP